jgi:hypothetical protein
VVALSHQLPGLFEGIEKELLSPVIGEALEYHAAVYEFLHGAKGDGHLFLPTLRRVGGSRHIYMTTSFGASSAGITRQGRGAGAWADVNPTRRVTVFGCRSIPSRRAPAMRSIGQRVLPLIVSLSLLPPRPDASW